MTIAAAAQEAPCPPMPQGRLCISQEAGNEAAKNRRLVETQEQAIRDLEALIRVERETTRQVRETAAQNEATLKADAVKLISDLANVTGKLTGAEATIQMQNATVQFLLTNGRKKCGVFTLICIQ
jgi:hypothetical protein